MLRIEKLCFNHACCKLCLFLVIVIHFVILAIVTCNPLFLAHFSFISNLHLNILLFVCIVIVVVATVEINSILVLLPTGRTANVC